MDGCYITDDKLKDGYSTHFTTEDNGTHATCTSKAICSDYHESYGKLESHNYTVLKNDESSHLYQCNLYEKINNKETHEYGSDNKCIIFTYMKIIETNTNNIDDSIGFSTGAVIGFTIGGFILGGALVFIILWILAKKKKCIFK